MGRQGLDGHFLFHILHIYVPFLGTKGFLGHFFIVRFLESDYTAWVTQMFHIPAQTDCKGTWMGSPPRLHGLQRPHTCLQERPSGHPNVQLVHHLVPRTPGQSYPRRPPMPPLGPGTAQSPVQPCAQPPSVHPLTAEIPHSGYKLPSPNQEQQPHLQEEPEAGAEGAWGQQCYNPGSSAGGLGR